MSITNFAELKCPNCGHLDSGDFCSECGQTLQKQRLTIKILLKSVVDFFYNIEDKYVHTFKELFLRPIVFLNKYIEGSREKYYIPFKYFFLNLSINFFVYTYFDLGKLNEETMEDEFNSIVVLKSEVMFDQIINNYGNFFLLFVIPVFVLIANKLFAKSKYNSAEKATAITYLFGQLFAYEIIFHLITAAYHPFHTYVKDIVRVIEIAIIFLLSYKFFKQSIMDSIWKTVVIIVSIYYSLKILLFILLIVLRLIYNEL
jgi:hypothetical protein